MIKMILRMSQNYTDILKQSQKMNKSSRQSKRTPKLYKNIVCFTRLGIENVIESSQILSYGRSQKVSKIGGEKSRGSFQ